MKNNVLIIMLMMFTLPIYSMGENTDEGTSLNRELPKDTSKELKAEDFSWANKKFSVGLESFTGIGFIGSIHAVNIAQLNLRVWVAPHLQISVHSSFNMSLNVFSGPMYFSTIAPVILNIGYGDSIKNFYWFIEGGGGYNLYMNKGPVLNISSGIEWLIFEHYSLGLKLIGGIMYGEDLKTKLSTPYILGDLSITANLVF